MNMALLLTTERRSCEERNFLLIADKPITEKLEGEFFNLFNDPAFNGLGTTIGSPTFGKITSALDPHNIEFKLIFLF
jgi:hypothetical protein